MIFVFTTFKKNLLVPTCRHFNLTAVWHLIYFMKTKTRLRVNKHCLDINTFKILPRW